MGYDDTLIFLFVGFLDRAGDVFEYSGVEASDIMREADRKKDSDGGDTCGFHETAHG